MIKFMKDSPGQGEGGLNLFIGGPPSLENGCKFQGSKVQHSQTEERKGEESKYGMNQPNLPVDIGDDIYLGLNPTVRCLLRGVPRTTVASA